MQNLPRGKPGGNETKAKKISAAGKELSEYQRKQM